MNTKQVIVLRKDLNMRKGKMVAQGAHASMAALLNDKYATLEEIDIWNNGDKDIQLTIIGSPELKDWLFGIFTKICVSVNSEEELLEIYDKAYLAGMYCSLIQDAGKTEFDGVPTYTAVAVGPGSSEEVDAITGHLKLL